ncbi:hypothetical protein Ah1_00265 [Aeromonas phage Ah1]|uniref:Uncharacterized protein n=1 Tax=Aeromonas phage Ah1 TaxID=2053701 RepID=A0A2H4YF48_9CAUD|nr:hypothetical protein KNT77_gp253 [Aeromonas phage Ah1]AUE22783.1 hypothetical protein Ah1_00265 [Aeromonas phage Ah1]
MKNSLLFAYNLRRQLLSGIVEDVGNFPIVVHVSDDEMEDGMIQLKSLIGVMRDSLEGKHGSKLLGLTVGDIWVTHIENEFNPFTFDINGQTYFCIQNLEQEVVESFFEE